MDMPCGKVQCHSALFLPEDLVEITRSDRFQPAFLRTFPMTASAPPWAYDFCIVKEIYTCLIGSLHTVESDLFVDLISNVTHAPSDSADTLRPE